MRSLLLVLALVVGCSTACHPGPVVDTNPNRVGGTIAGIVTTADSTVAVPGRKVTAVEVASGSRFDATTAGNGGYTIKVPVGTYRLEVELKQGDRVSKQPSETKIGKGDLDAQRNFVITLSR